MSVQCIRAIEAEALPSNENTCQGPVPNLYTQAVLLTLPEPW